MASYKLPSDHFGDVKAARKKFKEFSKEEFKDMGDSPLIKEVLAGAIKLNREEKMARIQEVVSAYTRAG